MTRSELETEVRKLKAPLSCNLFPDFDPIAELRILAEKRGDIWEVRECERGSCRLTATFDNESDLFEFILCRYKEAHAVIHPFSSRWERLLFCLLVLGASMAIIVLALSSIPLWKILVFLIVTVLAVAVSLPIALLLKRLRR